MSPPVYAGISPRSVNGQNGVRIDLHPIWHGCPFSGGLSPPTVQLRLKPWAGILVPAMQIQACAPALTNLQRVRVPDFPENRSYADAGLSAFGRIRQAGNSCRFCLCTFASISECTLATFGTSFSAHCISRATDPPLFEEKTKWRLDFTVSLLDHTVGWHHPGSESQIPRSRPLVI